MKLMVCGDLNHKPNVANSFIFDVLANNFCHKHSGCHNCPFNAHTRYDKAIREIAIDKVMQLDEKGPA